MIIIVILYIESVTETTENVESTTMLTTDVTSEPTTTESITLKSFSGSLTITSDVYTDSLADSSNSEFTAKSATHEAMVITFQISNITNNQ